MGQTLIGQLDEQRTAQAVTLKSHFAHGVIQAERPDREIAELVFQGKIVILKEALDPALVLRFRDNVHQWGNTTPPFPHGSPPPSDINYHRIDDGLIRSALPHIFHQYGFGNHETLEREVGAETAEIAEAMLKLQNAIAETRFDFSHTGARLKALHYAAGAGFLEQHVHQLEPQRVGLIAAGSRVGTDFVTGGTYFVTPSGCVDTTREHDIGDIILFRYDLPHGVSVVDQGKTLNWDSIAGKWSIVLELRATHSLSQALP